MTAERATESVQPNVAVVVMLSRSIVIWIVMLVLASLNGAVREALLIPHVGEIAGRMVSTMSLSFFIMARQNRAVRNG